jgi:D-tagatose 6-phosphate 4-epimerase
MTTAALLALRPAHLAGRPQGMTSVCSAHPQVIGAALALGRQRGRSVLIEATCNQVNQEGGYTGMTPADFRAFVLRLAEEEGFDPDHMILGGDHLGPNPWTRLPAAEAMARARAMIAAYAAAGFAKLHLDCSMSCADDPTPLPEAVIAARAADLAAVAEAHAPAPPVYVIGTEVPVPGGALELVEHLAVTTPQAAAATFALHRAEFTARGITAALDRVIGLVVQPGVEFGNENVVPYQPLATSALVAALDSLPLVFEAHSTDYQSQAALSALVRDGFAILKVGPGLTFALREALYGLDLIAAELHPGHPSLRAAMEALMLTRPDHWARYYPGSPDHQHLQRHFSYSDRIRYYWTDPAAQAAVQTLMETLGARDLPEPLISQYLAGLYPQVMRGEVAPRAPALLRAAITAMLDSYDRACHP